MCAGEEQVASSRVASSLSVTLLVDNTFSLRHLSNPSSFESYGLYFATCITTHSVNRHASTTHARCKEESPVPSPPTGLFSFILQLKKGEARIEADYEPRESAPVDLLRDTGELLFLTTSSVILDHN
ncbi:hypothetical protein A9K55_004469 [Cordyceps militaris]|uniref:Uncharacterized protein n=1 Tax=Cordyceps militaris TaxID=73501 RepID=A0A2H4SLE7_CORMI|nr:hypothetical protein A9K55_004469 [Cordyceps militaris]